MEFVYFYAPHFVGLGKEVPDHMSDFNNEILKRTKADSSDVFCVRSGLGCVLPVGAVVKFRADRDAGVVEFSITGIFVVARRPDVVFLELQLHYVDDEVTVDNFLKFFSTCNDRSIDFFWG